jgi:transcriptional regulator with XRE-family HTH domain
MACNKVKITAVLAKNLKALRESHNMTLDQLGKEIGVSRQAIWAIENEKSWITVDKIEKLAKTFNVEEDVLFQNRSKLK